MEKHLLDNFYFASNDIDSHEAKDRYGCVGRYSRYNFYDDNGFINIYTNNPQNGEPGFKLFYETGEEI